MGLKSGKEYIESIKKMKPRLFMFGEQIQNVHDHPIVKPATMSCAAAHDAALMPEYEELLTTKSHLTGEKIHRFSGIYLSPEDNIKKIKANRLLSHICPTCNVKCIGNDAFNAIYPTTFEIDQKYGTDYHKRFCNFAKRIQSEDLVTSAAITDVKGDRSLRPGQQADPDLHVHVVEKKKDGIIVRGAKAHETGVLQAHYTFVAPTTTLNENEKDYAVMFAVPHDAPGITLFYGRILGDERRLESGGTMDLGIQDYGVHRTALMILDNVFIPWEHVFMCGEYDFTRQLVTYFSSVHKLSSACCKAGINDVLIGAVATAAEYNGVDKITHINDKLATMTYLGEQVYIEAIGAAVEGYKTPAGNYVPSTLQSNVCKLTLTKNPYECMRLATDITGGLFRTLPSEKDYRNPEVGHYIEKYLKARADVPTENRMRILRVIENMTYGTATSMDTAHVSSGAMETSQMWIRAEGNIKGKKKFAKKLGGIKEVEEPAKSAKKK